MSLNPFGLDGDAFAPLEGDFVPTAPGAAPEAGAAGASVSYHCFPDRETDSGRILNAEAAFQLRQSETAHGLGWDLTENWAGAGVTVTALDLATGAAEPSLAALPGFLDPHSGARVRFDFPAGQVKPTGLFAFYARLDRAGRTEVTSGILVSVLPDLF